MQPQDKDSQPAANPRVDDDIFVVKQQPKEPVNKKVVWITTGLTITGILVLIAVLVTALVGSAGGVAKDYQVSAYKQLQKLNQPLASLEPGLVLNNRTIKPSLDAIYISKQSQPTLPNVLLVGDWNPEYRQTADEQLRLQEHYKAVDTYAVALGQLLDFDDEMGKISQEEVALLAKINTNDALSLHSASGNFEDFALKIKKMPAPQEMKKHQSDLVEQYTQRSKIYTLWAEAVEKGDLTIGQQLQPELDELVASARKAQLDKTYTQLFAASYKKLLTTQKALESALSN